MYLQNQNQNLSKSSLDAYIDFYNTPFKTQMTRLEQRKQFVAQLYFS